MGKKIPDLVFDAAFDYIAGADIMVVCNAEPTTYIEASDTYKLAEVAMSAGSYTKANDVSGRKITMGAALGVPIVTSGSASHIALLKVSDESIRLITTCTSQLLTSGGTVDIQPWKYNIQDPS